MSKLTALAVAALLTLAAAAPAQVGAAADPLAEFVFPGRPDHPGTVRREGAGLRVETPKPSWLTLLVPPANLDLAQTGYTAGGDIDFSAAYAVHRLGAPDRPAAGEANAELSLAGRGGEEHTGINVGWRPGTGKCFNVVRIHPNANGQHFNIVTFPRRSDTGRVGIKRRGAEIVFLAADGPGAPFAELIRYPYDPVYNPALRVSAFRGQGTEPAPVDVLLTDITLKVDRVVRGPDAWGVPPPNPLPAGYPVKIDYAKNPAGVLADFSQSNDKVNTFTVEGSAVRVRPPVAVRHRKGDMANYWRESRFAVVGDFEISWRVAAAKLGPFPKEGYGSCAVSLSLETKSPLGSVTLSRGAARGEGDRFSVTRYSPMKGGQNWDTQRFPAAAGPCRLTMRRTGAELALLAAEGDGPAKLLARIPFTPGPVSRLRLSVDQGGSATVPVDAVLSDLAIQAGAVVDPDNPTAAAVGPAAGTGGVVEQVVTDSAPRTRSRKWYYLGGGVVALLGAAAAGLAVFARRRRHDRG